MPYCQFIHYRLFPSTLLIAWLQPLRPLLAGCSYSLAALWLVLHWIQHRDMSWSLFPSPSTQHFRNFTLEWCLFLLDSWLFNLYSLINVGPLLRGAALLTCCVYATDYSCLSSIAILNLSLLMDTFKLLLDAPLAHQDDTVNPGECSRSSLRITEGQNPTLCSSCSALTKSSGSSQAN